MIANNKSFSLTAKELFLTQPTVSAYISKLEYELGEKLFYRTTKEVALTEAGKKIYIYRKMADKIENAFKSESEESVRRMVISTSSIPGTYLLPGILAEFSRMCPNVELTVHETDSMGVLSEIREHQVDLGFVGTTTRERGFTFIPFCRDELVLITPNTDKYRELRDKKADLFWIEQEAWILREEGSGTCKESLTLLKHMGIRTEHLHILARFNNTGAIMLSVAQGSGISIVSRLAAQAAIDRGEVLEYPIREGGAYRWISVVTNSTYPTADACRDMIRLIKKMYNC